MRSSESIMYFQFTSWTYSEEVFLLKFLSRRPTKIAHPIGQAKTWTLKTKVHVRSGHNQKHCFLLFII